MVRYSLAFRAMVPVAMLCLAMAGIALISVSSLATVTTASRSILDGEVAAQAKMAEANLALVRYGSIAYQLVSETRMSVTDELEAEGAEIAGTLKIIAGELKTILPDRAEELRSAMASFDAAVVGTEDLLIMAFANQQDKALKISSDVVEPALKAARTTFDDISGALKEAVADSRTALEDASTLAINEMILAAVGACLAGVGFAAFTLQTGIVRPLKRLGRTMHELADGDLGVEIVGTRRRDEIGEMARSVEVFKSNAIAMQDLKAREIESGRRSEQEKQRALEELASSFEANVQSVVAAVAETAARLQGGSAEMADASASTSLRVDEMAGSTEVTASNVQGVASATEELASSIADISRQVREASIISNHAAGDADRTRSVVMELANRAQRIGEVVGLINEIAAQTNLLALNATIEAARAGETGKGFAVVAAEVKNLATQTGNATGEIAAQVGAVQEATREAVTAIGGIVDIIGQISEISSGIAGAVEQQSNATGEIAQSVDRVAASAGSLGDAIETVREAAFRTGTATAEIGQAADGLSRQATTLAEVVDGFVRRLRSA